MKYYYTIRVVNESPKAKSPYTMTLGSYTRKNDAIKGLARMNLPNLRNSNVIIIASEGYDPVYCEVMTNLTSKTITTSRFNYRTNKEEGTHTYKFNY